MFTIEQLIQEVRNLAAKVPNNKYISSGNCYYDRGDCSEEGTGCIFGQAAFRLGEYWTGQMSIGDKLDKSNINFSQKQKTWCILVQKKQDFGSTWKEAVELADKEIS